MYGPTNALAVQYVRHIAAQIEGMGVSVDEWLALSGITQADLTRPDFSIDIPTFRTLSLDARRLSGEPALGLLVGERLGVEAHGALGYAAMSSRTIREVLDIIQRYIRLRIALITLSVEIVDGEVRVVLNELVPLGDIRVVVLEGVVCTIQNVLRDVSTGVCVPEAVAFPFPDPGYRALARSILHAPIRYAASWVGLVLPPRMLDLPLKMSDPQAFLLAEAHCRQELLSIEERQSWSARVQRVLLESRIGVPSLEETARRLHVTPRTLHRRLVAENTAFRKLVDARRKRSATEQLSSGDASIEEVAYILGYSDPANFRRAFRRWTGVSPSRYRARARLGEHCADPAGRQSPMR